MREYEDLQFTEACQVPKVNEKHDQQMADKDKEEADIREDRADDEELVDTKGGENTEKTLKVYAIQKTEDGKETEKEMQDVKHPL